MSREVRSLHDHNLRRHPPRRARRPRARVHRPVAPSPDRRRASGRGRRAHVRHASIPATGREIAEVALARRRGRRAGGRRRARRLRRGSVVLDAGGRTRAADARARRRDRGARRGDRPDRVARQRQARRARPVRGRQRRGRPPALLRRLADEDRGRRAAGDRAEHALLHPPRARRRVRADHPLELPAADGRVEARPGARRRLHDRAQARRADAAERAAHRRARARGRLPAGRAQRAHRRRQHRRGARRSPRRRQDRVHRLDRRRARDRRARPARRSSA